MKYIWAKEILDPKYIQCHSVHEIGEAQGFIEAVDKFKPVIEAIDKISSKNGLQYSDIFKICDEALNYYHREVLGEK